MTGMGRSSSGLTARRRKALYRAWHRGMRETDLILGGFADVEIGTLNEDELGQFECLLDCTDAEILGWVTGETEIPADLDSALFRRISSFRPGTGR